MSPQGDPTFTRCIRCNQPIHEGLACWQDQFPDILLRLADRSRAVGNDVIVNRGLLQEASNEIDKLRRDNARLNEKLRKQALRDYGMNPEPRGSVTRRLDDIEEALRKAIGYKP